MVMGDDVVCYGGNKDVDSVGYEFFVGFVGRGEGGDGMGEWFFEVEGWVDGVVEGIFGCGSVVVEEEVCFVNLGGEVIGGSWIMRFGFFSGGWRCGEGVVGD